MKRSFILIVLAGALLAGGCTTRQITLPNGATYKSTSFLTNPNIGAVALKGGRDNVDFSIGGYNHNQTQLLQVIQQLAALADVAPVVP